MRSNRVIAFVFAYVLAAFAMIGSAGATSANTDLTDIWWNPSESGWGMQMVNTGRFIFVTVYAYGPDGKPTWFGGGLDKTASGTFAGKLYVSTGPHFAGSFNPTAVNVREAGTMTFVPTTINSGQFTYSVDGVPVSKAVQRQPLPLDDYSGLYVASFAGTNTGCSILARNGPIGSAAAVEITQSGQSMSAVWMYTDGNVCTHRGTYSQLGRMGRFDATYSCTYGEVGTAAYSEMTNRIALFNARVQMQSPTTGCTSAMWMTGLSLEE